MYLQSRLLLNLRKIAPRTMRTTSHGNIPVLINLGNSQAQTNCWRFSPNQEQDKHSFPWSLFFFFFNRQHLLAAIAFEGSCLLRVKYRIFKLTFMFKFCSFERHLSGQCEARRTRKLDVCRYRPLLPHPVGVIPSQPSPDRPT